MGTTATTAPRPWTAKERDYLRANWGKLTAAQIGAALGRAVNVVCAAAGRFGLSRPRRKLSVTLLRRLHAAGWADAEIGRRLGVGDRTVCRWRQRLGLACVNPKGRPMSERARSNVRRGQRRWLLAHGYKYLAERREIERRVAVARRGWIVGTHREADVLDALEAGPKTRKQLRAIVGCPRRSLNKLLERLAGLGLVTRAGRTTGRGWETLWRLADGVRRGGSDRAGHKKPGRLTAVS